MESSLQAWGHVGEQLSCAGILAGYQLGVVLLGALSYTKGGGGGVTQVLLLWLADWLTQAP